MKTEVLNINHFFNKAQTRNGVIFDPNEEVWEIIDSNRRIVINFNKISINDKFLHSLKKTFKWYLENHSARHAENMYKAMHNLSMYLTLESQNKIKYISDISLVNYRGFLGKEKEWSLGGLSGFLKHWYKMGDSCLTKEAYEYLEETKFKSNPKGEAVLTMDPIKGPFSDLELESIQTAINNIYSKAQMKMDDYVLVWLFMIYGSRPIQFAQLKLKDIIALKQEDSYELFIKIPRVKNRKVVRSEFKRRVVPKDFAPVLYKYCEELKLKVKGVFPDEYEAPLFLGNRNINYDDTEFHVMKYHLTSAEITGKLKTIFRKLDLKSERTGEKIHITPIRFRRTLGTRVAAEGHGTLIVAEILDHTDTQNAQVYVESRPEIIERIDRAIALQMAPIAQAFAGTLVIDKSKAARANDPEADIINPSIDKTCTPSGKCGSYSYCGIMSPLACYTCSSFQAWVDGPHEMVLQHLIKERERVLEFSDYRVASINDKTIMAVAQVVKACQEYNSKNEVEVITDVY